MKKIKNLTMVILSMMLACTNLPSQVNANETGTTIEISPFYTHIASMSTALAIVSGNASCQSSIQGLTSNSELKIFMYLEKQVNGAWAHYDSWYTTKTGSSLTLTKNLSVSRGTYRVRTSYHANGENVIKYSTSKKY